MFGLLRYYSISSLITFIVGRAEKFIQHPYNGLHQSEERFRHIISSISDSIYAAEFTKEGTTTNWYLSPNFEALTGYPLDQFLTNGSIWHSPVIHPDERVKVETHAARLSKGQSSEAEYRLVRTDGTTIWVRDRGQVVSDDTRQSLTVYGVVSDVSEYKWMQETLRKQCTYLQQIIDVNPHFIFAKDHQGRFRLVNQAFAKAYGTTVDELIGNTDADFNPNAKLVERYKRDDLAVLVSGQELYIPEERIVNIQGQELWRKTIKRRIVDENGTGYQVLGIATDITELKETEEALTQAHKQAREANHLKTQLLANVSHDMRTPLGAILGYAEILKENVYGPLSDRQCTTISEIIDSAGQLLSFINNLMNLARIESGEVVLNSAHLAPEELLKVVSSSVGVLAQNKNIELTTYVAIDTPATVLADRYWLQQVLFNLVSNAIKFTEHGRVFIQSYRADEANWAIDVSDTGPGIPVEDQTYIFESFRQIDGTPTRKHGGSGVGLSIVKQLTHLMGGQVTLMSKVGSGSTFTITLPLEPIQETTV
jgi:PAS domain S-box-containing protein